MAQKQNIVEKLVGWIPGYKGYADKEARRDTDRLLREATVRLLEEPKRSIDRAIALCSQSMKFDSLESLEALRRRLATVSDRIRHAPQGYGGFFDTMKIDAAVLADIHDHDERLRELATAVGTAARGLESVDESSSVASASKTVQQSIEAVETHLRRRDELLKGAE